MALADELCAAAPTVMVVDDLQWADDASLLVWHQLAASIDQLRLLLIATCRSDPHRPQVQRVRTSLVRRSGSVVALGPLPETDVAALVTAMLGAPPEDTLRQLTAQAAGNPLYLRELVDALARERAQPSPAAGVRPAQEQLPASLAALLNDRLSSVSAQTAQILRTAALLDAKFTVTDLAVLLRRPVSALAAGLHEAVAARILVGSGAELAFRHQLIRQALYESMPTALRTALHAEAARELAATDADALSVQAVRATGRRKLIICALWTEICMAFTTLDALREGYEVYPVVDAIGGTSPEAHRAGLDRVVQAGGQPISWVSLACELQRDWARQDTVAAIIEIVLTDRLLQEQ
jgi:hypothetical protein